MAIIFTLPIVCGIILAYIFPFQSISMTALGVPLLCALVVANTLSIDWENFRQHQKFDNIQVITSLAFCLLFIYAICPFLLLGIAKIWIKDEGLIRGLVYCVLAPPALVAPFFCQVRGGSPLLSILIVFVTTVLCPVVTPLIGGLLIGPKVFVDYLYLSQFLFLTISMPFIISTLASKIFSKHLENIKWTLPYVNSILLAILIFILFGNLINKTHFNTISSAEIIATFCFIFLMDFGIYYSLKQTLREFTSWKDLETLPITLSMRNFAIPASTLLFFDGRSALPAALGFIVHVVFFACLLKPKSIA